MKLTGAAIVALYVWITWTGWEPFTTEEVPQRTFSRRGGGGSSGGPFFFGGYGGYGGGK